MYNCLYYSSLKISGNEQVFFVENLAPCVHCVAMAHQFQPHTGQIPLASSSHRQWKIFQETHLHPTTKTSVLAYFDSINHHWIKQPTAMCLSSSSKRPAPAFLPHEPSEQNKIHLPLLALTKMVPENHKQTRYWSWHKLLNFYPQVSDKYDIRNKIQIMEAIKMLKILQSRSIMSRVWSGALDNLISVL